MATIYLCSLSSKLTLHYLLCKTRVDHFKSVPLPVGMMLNFVRGTGETWQETEFLFPGSVYSPWAPGHTALSCNTDGFPRTWLQRQWQFTQIPPLQCSAGSPQSCTPALQMAPLAPKVYRVQLSAAPISASLCISLQWCKVQE